MVDERPLHRVQVPHGLPRGLPQGLPQGHEVGDALDGHDLPTGGGDGEHQATVDPMAVEQHRAGTTLPVVAALLGAREPEMLAQHVQERDPVVQRDAMIRTVDP